MNEAMTFQQAIENGYFPCGIVPGRGMCGLQQMAYTVGLFYDLKQYGYGGRYCYPTWGTAIRALIEWTGTGDPPDEHWIKHKGETEYSNPKNQHNDSSYAN